jgi:hypothetical protein
MLEATFGEKGWECPKCGAVMSPFTSCCVNCRGNSGGVAITVNGLNTPSIYDTKYFCEDINAPAKESEETKCE